MADAFTNLLTSLSMKINFISDSCGKRNPDSEFVKDSIGVLRYVDDNIPPVKASIDEQVGDDDNHMPVSYAKYKQNLDEETNIDYDKIPEHMVGQGMCGDVSKYYKQKAYGQDDIDWDK